MTSRFCWNSVESYFREDSAFKIISELSGRVTILSLFKADGLHLNDEGYAAWKAVIDPILKKAVSPQGTN